MDVDRSVYSHDPIGLLTLWHDSLTTHQSKALHPFSLAEISGISSRIQSVSCENTELAVVAVLYYYFKQTKISVEVLHCIGTQSQIAYLFDLSRRQVGLYWNALEQWLNPLY